MDTVGSALARYERVLIGKRAESTVRTYMHRLRWATEQMGATRPLTDVRLLDLEELLAAYRAERATNTAAHLVSVLRGFFSWCVLVELLERSPAARWQGPRRTKPAPKGFSEAALIDLLNRLLAGTTPADWREQRNEALVWFLVCVGARRAEAAALCWPAVDLLGQRLTLLGKGEKKRTVPIYSHLMPRLVALKASCGTSDGAVFPRDKHNGRTLHPYTINVLFQRWIVARLGVKLTPHVLRHTFAQLIMEEGGQLSEVQELLGHENIATTRLYYGKTPEKQLRVAVERLPLEKIKQ